MRLMRVDTAVCFVLTTFQAALCLTVGPQLDRRAWLYSAAASAGTASTCLLPKSASALVYLDPARYGDQELKNAAIAKCRTRIRDAVVSDPSYASRFYLLALLDGLSYDARRRSGGPDATVAASIQVPGEPYVKLREALSVLTEAQKALKRTNALTLADLIALAGAEAVAAVGGPEMSVQLGRTDSEALGDNLRAIKKGGLDEAKKRGIAPAIDLVKAQNDPSVVLAAFKRSGISDRESTALLGTLAVLNSVGETGVIEEKASPAKERGKIGRGARKAKAPLIDLYGTAEGDEEASVDKFEGDLDDFYIADAFGSRKEAYGRRVTSSTSSESNFNQLFVSLGADRNSLSWAENAILSDPDAKVWVQKYSTERLTFIKDLSKTFYRLTQLGAQYTGGKYAALLDNREIAKLE